MKPYLDWFAQGGLPILAILALSVVLYARCFKLLLRLAAMRRELVRGGGDREADALQRDRDDAQELFARHRISLGAMIAAAPLLGLLGTVSGMATTFEHLGGMAGGKSMEGLARGISEVLVATETGLAVAIPAMVLVFLAHRQVRDQIEFANRQLRLARQA